MEWIKKIYNNLSRLMFDTMSLRKNFPLIMVVTNFLDISLLRYNDLLHTEESWQSVYPVNQKLLILKF